jgi:hypothetical protein
MEPVQIGLSLTYELGPVCTACCSHHRPDDPNDLHQCLMDEVRFKYGVTADNVWVCSAQCRQAWLRHTSERRKYLREFRLMLLGEVAKLTGK